MFGTQAEWILGPGEVRDGRSWIVEGKIQEWSLSRREHVFPVGFLVVECALLELPFELILSVATLPRDRWQGMAVVKGGKFLEDDVHGEPVCREVMGINEEVCPFCVDAGNTDPDQGRL
ncbi:MAG: hypothetical protein BWY82_00329 [Verrucomicrobia bacterium ADurb.Bin474]|nr:MAG: hypothetical protein BWY82_00329 [Verrucomicrobia bacterium ADurb.Bin474]